MKTLIFDSYSDFLNRDDKEVNGVSKGFAKEYPNFENDNLSNEGCWNCSACRDCSYCRACSYCRDCRDCSSKNGELEDMIPKIKNIHQKVFDAVSKDHSKLDMNTWHTTCGTSHCRAGWVITIAGEEGRKLEELTDTCFAAMMIYKKSSNIKVPVVRFFEDQKIALEDIERCAKEEVNLINNTRPDY